MRLFRANGTNDETYNANEHNMVKNSNWQEADHLAIYKRVRGVEQ